MDKHRGLRERYRGCVGDGVSVNPLLIRSHGTLEPYAEAPKVGPSLDAIRFRRRANEQLSRTLRGCQCAGHGHHQRGDGFGVSALRVLGGFETVKRRDRVALR